MVWQKSAPTIRALKFTCANPQTLGIDNTVLGTVNPSFQYSTDGTTWNTWDITTTLAFGNGTDLYLRGSNQTLAYSGINYVKFVFSSVNDDVSCEGNVMHLLDYTQDLLAFPNVNDGQGVKNLFYNCSSLISAPSLPATTLAPYCYYSMFSGCTRLINAVKLPAMVLTEGCYNSMYKACSSLNSISALPATTLATNCYGQMFRGCIQIKMSATQDLTYPNEFIFGTDPSGYANQIFSGTGGSFIYAPTQTTYYTANTIIS